MAITLDPEREQEVRDQIAAVIRDGRARLGLSQAQLERELAKALGVDGLAASTIGRYERGLAVPPLGTLAALYEIFTGRRAALCQGLAHGAEPAPPARKRKESP